MGDLQSRYSVILLKSKEKPIISQKDKIIIERTPKPVKRLRKKMYQQPTTHKNFIKKVTENF